MLRITLRPSWILTAILAAAHGGAIAVVVAVGMPPWLQWIAVTALVVNFTWDVRRSALLRSPDAVVAIEIAADDAFSIQTRRGGWIECKVLGSTYVTAFLSILNLEAQGSGGTRRAVILPDSIDAEDFRKLRVWLRWKRDPQPG